jgi:hypothetical protein
MGEALDSRDYIPIGCESDPEPVGEALDSGDWIANGCESDPEPPTFAGEALDSGDWIPIGWESGPEPGRAKHWIAGIGSRLVVNQILNPYGRSIGYTRMHTHTK